MELLFCSSSHPPWCATYGHCCYSRQYLFFSYAFSVQQVQLLSTARVPPPVLAELVKATYSWQRTSVLVLVCFKRPRRSFLYRFHYRRYGSMSALCCCENSMFCRYGSNVSLLPTLVLIYVVPELHFMYLKWYCCILIVRRVVPMLVNTETPSESETPTNR